MKEYTRTDMLNNICSYKEFLEKMKVFSLGNTKINHIILNMGSATNCPSKALGLCKNADICYAMKAERCYPAVLPFRNRQKEYWLNSSAETIAKDILDIIEYIKKSRIENKPDLNYIRLNEAGDFHSQACVEKLNMIAELTNIKFYTYTARKDLDFSNIHKNVTINGSNFKLNNSFNVVDKKDVAAIVKDKNKHLCTGSCFACSLCKEKRDLEIYVIKH